MKHFCKLNVISTVFAVVFVLIAEYLMNDYGLRERFGFENEQEIRIIEGAVWATCGIVTCLGAILTHVWMKQRPSVFWSMLLWFPYAILLIRVGAFLLPERHPADSGSYAVGMILLLLAFVYPFFVGLTVLIGFAWPSRENNLKANTWETTEENRPES